MEVRQLLGWARQRTHKALEVTACGNRQPVRPIGRLNAVGVWHPLWCQQALAWPEPPLFVLDLESFLVLCRWMELSLRLFMIEAQEREQGLGCGVVTEDALHLGSILFGVRVADGALVVYTEL
jgi:hypothetical protein